MTGEAAFFKGWSSFKSNNLGLKLGKNLKFYTIVAKGLKLKGRKFCGLIPTFAEVTEEKLVGGGRFAPPPSRIGLRFVIDISCFDEEARGCGFQFRKILSKNE